MKRYLRVLAVALLVVSMGAMAQGPARAQLDAFAKGLHSLKGTFSQTLTDPNGHAGSPSTGTLALEAPRQFRWDTKTPFKQTIVADGSRVWLYDPSLEQVTVRKQSTEEAHSPLTVLTDIGQLDKNFKVTEQGSRDGLNWLRLTSTGARAQFDYADLGFNSGGLARMVFRDQLDAVTDIRFSNWQRNPSLPAGSFTFTPPPEADVIGDMPALSTQPLKP